MKVTPIINSSMPNWARNKNVVNKSMLIAPLLLAISTPDVLAKDVFDKTNTSEIVIAENSDKSDNTEKYYDYNIALKSEESYKNNISAPRALKKISKLEAKQNKYEEKLREKEKRYNLYNITLRAIEGDKDSKKRLLKHVQENSLKRDIGIFIGGGIAGIALTAVTGPVSLLTCIATFFTTNHVNNYIVEKKTNPKQKEEVVKEIKKLEDEMNEIKNDIKTIEFKISELNK